MSDDQNQEDVEQMREDVPPAVRMLLRELMAAPTGEVSDALVMLFRLVMTLAAMPGHESADIVTREAARETARARGED